MRERHRRKQANGAEASFAAQAIDITKPADARYAASVLSMSKGKSATAWDWYDKLGEIHYAVSRSSKVAGYAELGVYKLEPNGDIGEQVTSGMPADIAAGLYSPYGGERGLVERFLTLMKVPADSYLIQTLNDGVPDGYDFVSADELRMPDPTSLIHATSGSALQRITMPAKSQWDDKDLQTERVAPAQFIGRVWKPSPRFVDVPDSPMIPLDSACELLHLLTVGLRAKLLSRLANNGIMYIPSEVNDARSAAPSGEAGEFHQNKVLNTLIEAAVYASRNPTAPEAAMPIFMSGPGIHGDQFKHIVMDQELYATDMELRNELIHRILTGLDIQPMQVAGVHTGNHWAAWASSEDELRVSVRPDLETMCWALTRLVLWKQMQDAGQKPGAIAKHVIWFDMSKAQSHQNIAEDARQMADRVMISPEATRRATGWGERDAPTPVDYIRMVGIKLADPYLATFQMTEADKFDWTKIGSAKTGPPADSQAPDSNVGPGKGQPGSPADSKSDTPKRLRPA